MKQELMDLIIDRLVITKSKMLDSNTWFDEAIVAGQYLALLEVRELIEKTKEQDKE